MAKLYKIKNGEKVPITNYEARKYIQSKRGWSDLEYEIKYSQAKRGLRRLNYLKRNNPSAKTEFEKQSPLQYLYKQTKSIENYGKDYKPSLQTKLIEKLSGRTGEKITLKEYTSTIATRFEGLVASNDKAREIYNAISDPIKREQALAEYANRLHAKIDAEGRALQNQDMPFSSQVYGSDTSIDFDYSDYL